MGQPGRSNAVASERQQFDTPRTLVGIVATTYGEVRPAGVALASSSGRCHNGIAHEPIG
ncbi:MAG: hypothetical protein ABJC19_05945 [Gemmatimonadota bacterium]